MLLRHVRPRRMFFSMVALCAVGFSSSAGAAAPAAGAQLPDTGLFAPVAAQQRALRVRLSALAGGAVTAERLRLLLATGQVDEAAVQAPRAVGNSIDVAVIRGMVDLTRQEFGALRLLVDRLGRDAVRGTSARQLRYDWLYARDDAAAIDSLTGAAVRGQMDGEMVPELLAAGRLAYDMLNYPRADSLFSRALAALPQARADATVGGDEAALRSIALTGRGLVRQKLRDWDASLVLLRDALAARATPNALLALTESLIRLGRTDEAISAAQWAVRLNPYHEAGHYLLGNGYARRNYSQLRAASAGSFADRRGERSLAAADSLLAAGDRAGARRAYGSVVRTHPSWADARVRLASLDFEDGRFAESRDGCFAALRQCPEYGRAHAVLAKALEAQRFQVDVHRADYEARFAAAPLPEVPGIESFVGNWRSLSPRHQKRVALSMAPWRSFIPVLVEGGATFYVKPLYMLLSECPNLETLRDQRIGYDSRLWDDVRGCGGYHTVTGIEDVERTVFDRYNTVLHELSHQVHGVLPADDGRNIQEHYRRAKDRDETTREGFLSRYAGGSVYEYFAEGVNALASPMRDAYDPREIVRERLDRRDRDLRRLVEQLLARTEVGESYPIAYAAGGDDRVGRGQVDEGLPFYRRALERSPANEVVLLSFSQALALGNHPAQAESVAALAAAAQPTSGAARVARAEAAWHAGRDLGDVMRELAADRSTVRTEDRAQVAGALGRMAWNAGDAQRALAEYDSVLAYQADSPQGLGGRAMALSLAGQSDSAFVQFDRAVRVRTGEVGLRCAYAEALLTAGRLGPARTQLHEAELLDERQPEAEALRAWSELLAGRLAAARRHARRALEWGPWSDLAVIVAGGIEARAGNRAAADRVWAPVLERVSRNAPPENVYRTGMSAWEETHTLPATQRRLLASFQAGAR
jgi:tetratricopeptide (TPR) repeat protein